MSIAAKFYALNQTDLSGLQERLDRLAIATRGLSGQLQELQAGADLTDPLLQQLKTTSMDDLKQSVNAAFADLQRQKNLLNTQLSQASRTTNQIDQYGAGSAATSVLGDPNILRQQIQSLDQKMAALTEFTRQVAQNGDLAGLLAKLEAEQSRSLR